MLVEGAGAVLVDGAVTLATGALGALMLAQHR